jgi:putative endopeptidase
MPSVPALDRSAVPISGTGVHNCRMRSPRPAFISVLVVALLCQTTRLPGQRPTIHREYEDTTVRACTDFYSFANGGWLRNAVIPESEQGVSGFSESSDSADKVLNDILKTAAVTYRTSSDRTTQRLGAFYASCMDTARATREGLAPIRDELARIDRIASRADLSRELAHLQVRWVDAAFGTMPSFASLQVRVWAYADMKNSKKNILWLFQGGIGLPEGSYYTATDSASKALRVQYQDHIERTLALAGESQARARSDAATILSIETRLGETFLSSEQRSVPTLVYEPTTIDKLARMVPAIDWPVYFAELGLPRLADSTTLSVSPSRFFRRLNEQLTQRPLSDWRAYLRWQLLNSVGSTLGGAAQAEDFRFRSLFTGITQRPARDKFCTSSADALMGMAIGKLYVQRTFPPAAKSRIEQLVQDLKGVLRQRLATNDWMGDATKKEALQKVDSLRVEVGYPDQSVDYSAVPVSADKPFVQNVMLLRKFEDERHLAKLNKPVDRDEWEMSPATVNAYNNPQFNSLFFPAAILQPPFFSANADDALNYGAIGWVIGHELTHFFDDQGRQFDANGNLRDWWTPEDAKRYQERAQVVRRQYDSYVVIDTTHLNGSQTLNENTADIGGLAIAYHAYHRALAAHPTEPRTDGLTPDQAFFLAGAQAWRSKMRPQFVRLLLSSDNHSPPRWRANGPMSSSPEFAAAFACKEGDAMVRTLESRSRLW